MIFCVLSSQWYVSPSPLGGSSCFCCCSLLEEDDEDRFVVFAWDRTVSRSSSIIISFRFRASISFSLRRSSTCTSVKPSSHSLLISTTAALASISMMEVNLLWKATQLSMSPRFSTSAHWSDATDVKLTLCGRKSRKVCCFGRGTRHNSSRLRWKTWKCNTIVTGNACGHVTQDVRGLL